MALKITLLTLFFLLVGCAHRHPVLICVPILVNDTFPAQACMTDEQLREKLNAPVPQPPGERA